MNVIWILTSLGNVALGLLMLFRGHYIRYSWLFFSTIFSVIADMFAHYAFVNDPARYAIGVRVIYLVCLALNGLIIGEAFCLHDRRVQIPVECYLGMCLMALVAEKCEFLMTAYYMQCGLRIFNLAIICWFIIVFKGEPTYEPVHHSDT